MKIGDKVYVSNWGKQYSDFYRWNNGKKELIWEWKTNIPNYSSTMCHWKIITEPILTQKGKPYKDGSTKVVDRIPLFKNYEYTILEKTTREDGEVICLLSSNHTEVEPLKCFVQIGEKGLTTLSKEEQEAVQHLEHEKYLQALAKMNLNKWSIDHDLREFPKELLKVLYDKDQRVLFGSSMTKGIVTYNFIPKEYTINGNNLYVSTTVDYNGKGCNLTGKKTISFKEIKTFFPEQI